MEVTITGGHDQDGLLAVDDFTFNAFCLISVEPCFESAAAMFSAEDVSEKFSLMMEDVKREFSSVPLDVNGGIFEKEQKGGEDRLDEKLALLEEFGLKQDELAFNMEELTVEELREKFEEMKAEAKVDKFALTEQFIEELRGSLRSEIYQDPYWGEMPRYSYVDCDMEKGEVYAYDCEDWKLYGFSYAMNGDNVIVDFGKKKRMKCSYVEFDEGEQPGIFGGLFSAMADKAKAKEQELTDKYNALFESAAAEKAEMQAELDTLRQYKLDVEEADMEAQREELFSKFEDLSGNEQFEALREECKSYELDVLEEKCFAIRGRLGVPGKFSVEKPAKLLVGGAEKTPGYEPYGDLFKKYGTEN